MAKSTSHITKELLIIRTDASTNTVMVTPAGGDKFDGEGFSYTVGTLVRYEPVMYRAGINYWTGVRSGATQLSNRSGLMIIDNGINIGQPVLMTDTATTSSLGVSSIATQEEVNAGTNDTKIITPKKLKDSFNINGSAPMFAARAWCSFNGATGTIMGSGNIKSITRVSGGTYDVAFSTPMQNTNYAVICNANSGNSANSIGPEANTKTVNGFRLNAWYGGDNTVGKFDPAYGDFVVFG